MIEEWRKSYFFVKEIERGKGLKVFCGNNGVNNLGLN